MPTRLDPLPGTEVDVAVQLDRDVDDGLLVPYVEGSGLFPQEMPAGIYKQLEQEELLEWVFPGWDKVKLSDFMKIAITESHFPVFGFSRSEEKVAGIGWLFEVEGPENFRKASLGFAFFRKFHHSDLIRSLARQAVRWWFERLKLCVLYGATRRSNRATMWFASELGFSLVGLAPRFFVQNGKAEDAFLYCIVRENVQGLDSQPDSSTLTER